MAKRDEFHRVGETLFVIPAGNERRSVACECGATKDVPVNALTVKCDRCGAMLVSATVPSVMQR